MIPSAILHKNLPGIWVFYHSLGCFRNTSRNPSEVLPKTPPGILPEIVSEIPPGISSGIVPRLHSIVSWEFIQKYWKFCYRFLRELFHRLHKESQEEILKEFCIIPIKSYGPDFEQRILGVVKPRHNSV